MSDAAQKFGLNKAARIRAERAASREDLSGLLLQPDFPYDAIAFDPGFFGLGQAAAPGDEDAALTSGAS